MAFEIPGLQEVDSARGLYVGGLVMSSPDGTASVSPMDALIGVHAKFARHAHELYPGEMVDGIFVPFEFAFTALVIRLAGPRVMDLKANNERWEAALSVISRSITQPELKGANALLHTSPMDFITGSSTDLRY